MPVSMATRIFEIQNGGIYNHKNIIENRLS